MKTLYDLHYMWLGFTVGHSILANWVYLSPAFFIVEALIGLVSIASFAWIDYSGFEWRWPLAKRPLNQVGTFD